DEVGHVPRLEVVRGLGESASVGYPVKRGSGGEDVGGGHRAQRGPATGATATDGQPRRVGVAACDQGARRHHAVVDVSLAPGAVQPLPIGPAVAGGAAVVDVEHPDAAAGE